MKKLKLKLNKEKVKEMILNFMEKNGLKDFPTASQFFSCSGGSTLIRYIYKSFDSLNQAREEMGFSIKYRSGEYSLKHWENLKKGIQDIVIKIGHFPTSNELKKLNKVCILKAAQKYHGGLVKLKEKFKKEQSKAKTLEEKILKIIKVKGNPFSIKEIYDELKKEKKMKENRFDALKIGEILDRWVNLGLLKEANDGRFEIKSPPHI